LGVDRMDPQVVTSPPSNDQLGGASHTPDNLEPTSPVQFKDDPPYCKEYDHHFFKKVPHGAEAVNILVGETYFLRHPVAAFVRLREACRLGEMTEVPVPTRFMFILLGTAGNGAKYQQIGRAMGTLFSDEIFLDFATRSTSRNDLLAGIDEFLSASSLLPPAQWEHTSRIEPPPEPPSQENRKAVAAAVAANATPSTPVQQQSDTSHHSILPKLHHHHHHHKNDRSESPSITAAAATVATTMASGADGGDGGGGKGSSSSISPSKDAVSMESGEMGGGGVEVFDRTNDPALMRTGHLFGGLIRDIKRRAPSYLSDFTDALHIQCFASFFFLYFACLTPIITFGGLLSNVTGGYLGTMESIVSGAVVGILYALFAGQPLTIMGSTGPVLIFESIIYRLCESNRWSYLSFRFWIGMWVALVLFVMVAFDLSALVRFITRFTEESFALLIALIFIFEAIKKSYSIANKYPVNLTWKPFFSPPANCSCTKTGNYTDAELLEYAREEYPILDLPFVGTNDTDAHHHLNENGTIDWDKLNQNYYSWESMEAQRQCEILRGKWNNEACKGFYAPDIFFFCILLTAFCFFLAYGLRSLRNSRFFPSRIRSLISDFAVLIAIVICSLIDSFSGLHTPKLLVPISFEPTLGYNKRGWIIPPFNGNPWWSSLVAAGPALLAVILIFMDQQITAVIVNRRENKLKKGAGYHLDLLIVTITIAVNSVLGIPWFVAATVLSINHVISLKKESESAAPGERPIFLGCREQRVTGFFIFLFIGLSVFMSSILRVSAVSSHFALTPPSTQDSLQQSITPLIPQQRIPMAVLYGVFLLMGITSLNGLQLMERVGLFFTPAKYQPDYTYLRHVRLGRIHLFTVIQVLCLILLYVIKSVPQISILFPLMVLAMCFVRRALDFVFTQEELYWLDDILPDSSCSRKRKSTSTGPGRRYPSANDFSSKDSLPLSQPILLNTEEKPFSVSEEVSKTLIWRQLSGIGLVNQGGDDEDRKTRRDRKKKEKRRHHRSGGGGGYSSGNETSDSHRGSGGGGRFRSLRLFSSDFDGAIGRDIAVLFHANETDSAAGGGANPPPPTSNTPLTTTAHLPTPEIKINPPSHQTSPSTSRRNSDLPFPPLPTPSTLLFLPPFHHVDEADQSSSSSSSNSSSSSYCVLACACVCVCVYVHAVHLRFHSIALSPIDPSTLLSLYSFVLFFFFFFFFPFHVLFLHPELSYLSRFCYHNHESLLRFEIAYPEILGLVFLNAYWNAPEIWDVAYSSRMTCEEELILLQNFSPNQKVLLSAEENSWCEHVDLRNFAHPFELPDFREAESGMVERMVEIDSRYRNHSRHDFPRQLYTFPLESHHSSILQSVYSLYRSDSSVSPNWVYCKSPDITFTPGKISCCASGCLISSVVMSQDKSHLRYPLLLFFGIFLFAFLKWLFALMCMGHLSNAGRRPLWLEIISDLMGGAANCALVALLLLLASGYRIVHRDPGKRLTITLIATVAIYGLVQLACGITTTLAFDSGRAKYLFQSPTGYTLVALNVVAWLVFLLVAMYTNTHWPAKRLFYLQLICFYSAWFWILPIILIINGDYIALWRRLALHRSISSTVDLVAHVYMLYIFWPTNMARTFIQADATGEGDITSLTQAPRTSITPVTVPPLSTETKSPRSKTSRTELDDSGQASSKPKEPKTPSATPRKGETPDKDAKSNFLKKLMQ
uniref:Anion exchange protein n=1 Tax=Taenia asiatica TaxID=60517 RepID=A0A158RAE0_TAEAS